MFIQSATNYVTFSWEKRLPRYYLIPIRKILQSEYFYKDPLHINKLFDLAVTDFKRGSRKRTKNNLRRTDLQLKDELDDFYY